MYRLVRKRKTSEEKNEVKIEWRTLLLIFVWILDLNFYECMRMSTESSTNAIDKWQSVKFVTKQSHLDNQSEVEAKIHQSQYKKKIANII